MICWTEQAAEQLDNIYSLTASGKNEHGATELAERIIVTVQMLVAMQMDFAVGKTILLNSPRECSVHETPFTIAYIIKRDRIVVLALYEGRTNVVQLTKHQGASREN